MKNSDFFLIKDFFLKKYCIFAIHYLNSRCNKE